MPARSEMNFVRAWLAANGLFALLIIIVLDRLKAQPLNAPGAWGWAVAGALLLLILASALPVLACIALRRRPNIVRRCGFAASAILLFLGVLMIVQS